jgi:hypothetical protein
VAGDWRRLHNEELHNLYSPLNIIKVIKSRRTRWVGYRARNEETRNEWSVNLKEKPLGRPKRRCDDNS